MLIEHAVDDMNECFIAVEESMTACQQVRLKPALALMLAKYFKDSAILALPVFLSGVNGMRGCFSVVFPRYLWEPSLLAVFDWDGITAMQAQ